MVRNSGVVNDHSSFEPGEFLIADSGFSLTPTCLTPFTAPALAQPHRAQFNRRLSSCRAMIERAFGRLKQRWRHLLLLADDMDNCTDVVLACFVLHNFCLMQEGDELLDGPWWHVDPTPKPRVVARGDVDLDAEDFREQLAMILHA